MNFTRRCVHDTKPFSIGGMVHPATHRVLQIVRRMAWSLLKRHRWREKGWRRKRTDRRNRGTRHRLHRTRRWIRLRMANCTRRLKHHRWSLYPYPIHCLCFFPSIFSPIVDNDCFKLLMSLHLNDESVLKIQKEYVKRHVCTRRHVYRT